MFDIETLGTRSTSVILSIGVAQFDERGIHHTFERTISIDSCLSRGLTVDASTICWWMGQSEEARKVFSRKTIPLVNALEQFMESFSWSHIDEVWANGTDFDLPILAHAFEKCGKRIPWAYYKVRDYRTVKSLFPREVVNALKVSPLIAHNALDDAIAQAVTLRKLLESPHNPFVRVA